MPDPKQLYDLIVIGAGSAAAYYLNTLDPAKLGKNPPGSPDNPITILVIGKEDPWAAKRGYDAANPTLKNINHPVHQVAQFGSSAPQKTTELQDRSGWAAENLATIRRHADMLDAEVTDVAIATKPPDMGHGNAYKIVLQGNTDVYWAKKVVVATGAAMPDDNFYKEPPFIKTLPKTCRDRCMDMDKFNQWLVGKATDFGNGKTVIVMGPNAAIDAVETSRSRGFAVVWLSGIVPGTLATEHQKFAEEEKKKAILYPKEATITGVWDAQTQKFTVTVSGKPPVPADYITYSVGQDPKRAAPFLRKIMNGGANIEPIYDINQRFGSDPAQHVLGLQLKGTTSAEGLEIIGAANRQLLMDPDLVIQHSFQDNVVLECAKHKQKLQDGYFHLYYISKQWCPALATRNLNGLDDYAQFVYAELKSQVATYMAAVREDVEKAYMKHFSAKDKAEAITAAGNYAELFLQCVRTAQSDTYKSVKAEKSGKKLVTVDDIERAPKAILTKNVPSSQQLGGIKAMTAAQQGFVPAYVGKQTWDPKTKTATNVGKFEVNPSSDDQTMLRVYIAMNYPFIDDDKNPELENIIHQQIQIFIKKREKEPWGMDPDAFDKFLKEDAFKNPKLLEQLRRLNRMGEFERHLQKG